MEPARKLGCGEQRGLASARRAHDQDAARIDTMLVREPARGSREIFERDALERAWQPRLAEVGRGERREAVERELFSGSCVPQASLGAADDHDGRPSPA